MKCPKCGREMETGFIQWEASDDLAWLPKVLPLGLAYWKNNAEILWPNTETIGVNAVPASICKSCRTVILEYGELK